MHIYCDGVMHIVSREVFFVEFIQECVSCFTLVSDEDWNHDVLLWVKDHCCLSWFEIVPGIHRVYLMVANNEAMSVIIVIFESS